MLPEAADAESPTPAGNGEGSDAIEAGLDGEIAEVVKALRRAVDAKVGLGLDCSFAERERAALIIGNEAPRRLLEQELPSTSLLWVGTARRVISGASSPRVRAIPVEEEKFNQRCKTL